MRPARFRHLPNHLGHLPSPREVEVYEVARQDLASTPGAPPRFLALPGAAVAVVAAVGEDGRPCLGLAVQLAGVGGQVP